MVMSPAMDVPHNTGTVNGVPIEAILDQFENKPELVERIAYRKVKAPQLAIVESDASWSDSFQIFRSRILDAFGQEGPDNASEETATHGSDATQVRILSINHVGSTAVPKLPAKAVIDIDLVLSSVSLACEAYYVPRLEAAGFQYLLREPAWHDHRFFCASEPMSCNLHVWGPQCPEVERHRIFRDWLRKHDADRELYAKTKQDCAVMSREKGEMVAEYNLRKEGVVRDILTRAFTELGYISG